MSSVLVTGASRGIGRAISIEFARRGHRVIGTARDPRSLEDLDLDQRLALDVTDDASVTAAIAAAGDVDVVIVNPAEIFYAAVEAIPLIDPSLTPPPIKGTAALAHLAQAHDRASLAPVCKSRRSSDRRCRNWQAALRSPARQSCPCVLLLWLRSG